MQPIVNGLQEDYQDQVTFVSLNAKDSADGEALFQKLSLPGHPSIVIYTTNGEEVFRQFGIKDDFSLNDKLDEVLEE